MNKQRASKTEGGANVAVMSKAEVRAPYSDIFKGLPAGVLIFRSEDSGEGQALRIVDANPSAARLAGTTLEDLRGRTLDEFPQLCRSAFLSGCREVLESGEPRNLGEISCSGSRVWQGTYSVRLFPLRGALVGAAFDAVASVENQEQDRAGRKDQFRLFVQAVREYAMFQLDPKGHVVTWNSGAERLKGYRASEILGKQFSAFYLPEDVKSGKPARLLAQAAEHGQVEDEGWRVRKDKSLFWANVVVTALRDEEGVLQGFAKITRDTTERHEREQLYAKAKEQLELRVQQRTAVLARVNQELRTEIAERHRAEQQLRATVDQLRALGARLQTVREEERGAMAREIHDELGQACTAVKMDLALIGRKTAKSQAQLRTKIGSTIRLVDEMIATLRRIASELRPRTLDDLGLTAALEWQAREFESRTHIACQLTLPQEPFALDNERSIAIFRIFQESLTNVVRHARATRVEARLEKIGSQIVFRIQDNGTGFDQEEAKRHKSFGLAGMQERALLLNGELKIDARPSQGTSLTLRIPVPPGAAQGL